MNVQELIDRGNKLIEMMHDEYWEEENEHKSVVDIVYDHDFDNLDRIAIMLALDVVDETWVYEAVDTSAVVDAWLSDKADDAVADAVANGYVMTTVTFFSGSYERTYEEKLKATELDVHARLVKSGETVTSHLYVGSTDDEYIKIDDKYYDLSDVVYRMIEDVWVYSLDSYDEVIQYVKDIFGSDYVRYDIEGLANAMFKKVVTDGHEEWHLIDVYRDRDGYGTDATWELAQEYDKDYEYVIKYTRDVLMDEAPGLKPWQYDKLANLLEQHWKYSMHEDIQDLLWIVKE